MKHFPILQYLLYLILTVPAVLILWTIGINGKLYYCSDKVPVLDFIPPFVHSASTGDYYIIAEPIVWTVWLLFVVAIFTIPLIFVKFFSTKK